MLSVTATNPSVLVYILAFTGLACVLSLAAVAGYLLLPERYRDLSLGHFVSFATGTLLGVAFLDLLPQALVLNGSRGAERIMVVVLVGIFVFFILEKALIWRHAHHLPGAADHHHHHHGANAGALIMVGDTFHNFLDGILLTAVFVTDVQLGIVTGIALNSAFRQVLGIRLGFKTLVIAHTTFCIVVVYNNVLARLRRLPGNLEEASADLGAGAGQTFWYVTFPLLRSALFAGGLLAFALSFDEIVVTTFTAGAGFTTLPQFILGKVTRPNELPVVNVVAVTVVLLSIIPAYVAQRIAGEGSLRTSK